MSLPFRHHRRQPLKTYSRKTSATTAKTTDARASKRARLSYDNHKCSASLSLALDLDVTSSELDGAPSSDPPPPPPFDDVTSTPLTTPPTSSPPPPDFIPPQSMRPSFTLAATTARTHLHRVTKPKSTKKQQKQKASHQQLTQLTLDLGQQLRYTCSSCGMSYHPSDPSDLSLHKRFHAKALAGIEIPGGVLSKTLWTGESEAEEGWRVACIDRRSPISEKRKAREVLNVVDAELGAATIPDSTLWDDADERYRVYVLCAKSAPDEKRVVVVGFLLAERITKAYRVLSAASGLNESSSVEVSQAARSAVLGISRIWTAKEFRRKGVAKRLLEVARDVFVYGMKVPKEKVAFSQPTESGGRLARAWFEVEEGQGGWMVYDESR